MSGHDDGNNVRVQVHEQDGESDKACRFLVAVDDIAGTWIPKSQIAHYDDDAGELWIPLWLAEKKGLEYE